MTHAPFPNAGPGKQIPFSNVGKWDRHEALRENFEVRALATYIVLDPKTSKLLAKTTLEPITKKGQKLTAEQWAGWLSKH